MKEKIKNYYAEIEGDYDPEEIDNAIEILDGYDNNLKGLTELDSKLLIRVIDNEKLIAEIELCTIAEVSGGDPFADL